MSETGEEKPNRSSRWHEPEAIRAALLTSVVALLVALVSGAASFYAAWTVASGKSRELDIKLVEVGIAILRADPKDENTAKIRHWAIELVEKNSHEAFTPEEKAEMLGKAVKANFAGDWGLDTSWDTGNFARRTLAPIEKKMRQPTYQNSGLNSLSPLAGRGLG